MHVTLQILVRWYLLLGQGGVNKRIWSWAWHMCWHLQNNNSIAYIENIINYKNTKLQNYYKASKCFTKPKPNPFDYSLMSYTEKKILPVTYFFYTQQYNKELRKAPVSQTAYMQCSQGICFIKQCTLSEYRMWSFEWEIMSLSLSISTGHECFM